jgi:uncharacterized protein
VQAIRPSVHRLIAETSLGRPIPLEEFEGFCVLVTYLCPSVPELPLNQTNRPPLGNPPTARLVWWPPVKFKKACTLKEMIQVTETLLREMTKTIVDTAKPRKVILFGSWAQGNACPDSDVDILVIQDEPFGPGRSRRKEMTRLWQALSKFDRPKDILLYASEEEDKWKESRNHMVAHALRSGRVLYER